MKLGVIGGSGLYELGGLEGIHEVEVKTPFGAPSAAYVVGSYQGQEVVFLPRHGIGHRYLPSEINYRANIFGFKTLGVDSLLSVNAVGSLREDFRPRDLVLPDQFYDRTKGSERHTFFGDGIVAHVGFGEPVCRCLRGKLRQAAEGAVGGLAGAGGLRVHDCGCYVNMEGPAFSTKAESQVYRKLGFDVVGMTSMAEARLCREAEICFCCLALVTDYDCWYEHEDAVSVDMVLSVLRDNVSLAKDVIRRLLALKGGGECACGCRQALQNAIMTDSAVISAQRKKDLAPIIGKYLR